MSPRRDVLVNVGEGAHDLASSIGEGPLTELLHRAVVLTLDEEAAPDAEISVTLLGDDPVRAMNREYLSMDRVTDVIAFCLGDDPPATGEDPAVLGDVYIGLEQARRQAGELGIAFEEEVARLVIHGTLHVLGHDHPDGDDRADSPMYHLQERLLGEVLTRP